MSYEERVEGKAHDGFPGEAWCVRADDTKRIAREADTEIAALRAKLAEAEAKLARAMRVVEAARVALAPSNNNVRGTNSALVAALAAMTPDATITREDA